MFVPYASEIWTKSYGPNYKKFWAFREKKKQIFYNPIWRHFGRRFRLKIEPNMADLISLNEDLP